jgi:hypothetical protein
MKHEKCNIYKLLHPDTLEIKYIGVTVNKLSQRLSHHMYTARSRRGTIVSKWIWSLIQEGKKPIIELIETCDYDDWENKEKFYISKYKDNIYNQNEGGHGVVVDRSKTSIQRSADAHKIKVLQLSKEGEVLKCHNSIREASKATKILYTNIGNVLKGRTIHAGGYHWVYESKYIEGYVIPPNIMDSESWIERIDDLGNIEKFSTFPKACASINVKSNKGIKCAIHSGEPYEGYCWKIKK